MKIIIAIILCIFVSTYCKLKTETSCQVGYVYYPISADNSSNVQTATYTQTTIGNQVVSATVIPTTVEMAYPVSTYTTAPMVVYYARKGDQKWRVSVLDENNSKNFKSKGEKIMTEKNGSTWFSHDKVNHEDEGFKTALKRCQSYNWQFSSRKGAAQRTTEVESKVVKTLPSEFFDLVQQKTNLKKEIPQTKVEEKKPETKPEAKEKKTEAKIQAKVDVKIIPTPSVEKKVEKTEKTDVKIENKNLNAANTPVQNEKKEIPKVRFLQKKQDEMDLLDDDNDLKAFQGESIKPAQDNKDAKKEHFENEKDKLRKEQETVDNNHKSEKANLVEKSSEQGKREESEDDGEDDVKGGHEAKEENVGVKHAKINEQDHSDQNDDNSEISAEGNISENLGDEDDSLVSNDKAKDDEEEEIPEEQNNELIDDDKAVNTNEETEAVMDMEEEDRQDELEDKLKDDLNADDEHNPDLL